MPVTMRKRVRAGESFPGHDSVLARLPRWYNRALLRARRISLVGLLLVLVVTLGFFLLYWNRFAGIRSGLGGYGGGSALLQGLRPYRDYFTAATPLYILTCGAALRIFGNAIAVTRAFGVFERLVIATLIYSWLSRFFAARHALVATIVTMIVSSGDISDPISSYNHETIMWAIGSGFAASFALDDGSSTRTAGVAAIASGFLAGLSFATKQTMGLGATVFIPAVVSLCLLRLAGIRKAATFLLCFVAGWGVSAGLLLLWLNSLHILREFFTDVFLKGPAAKGGSATVFLRRDLSLAHALWLAASLGLIGVPLLWKAFRRTGVAGWSPGPGSYRSIFEAGLLCAAAVATGAIASYAGVPIAPYLNIPHLDGLAKPAIFLDVFATLALLACYSFLWLRGTLSGREAQFFLLVTVSFVMAFMVSLSYPVFEAMLLPGLGFLTAAALDGLRGRRVALVYLACGSLLVAQTCLRLDRPFGFEGFDEPAVRTATAESQIPELRGLRLPPEIVEFIDGTARIVAEHTSANDTIFTYPEMGIFYAVTHRRFPTTSGSHNIDVVNDSFASEEAERLLAGRPAVLIYYRESEADLRSEEMLWRGGHRMGQRDIIAAMETLAAQYDLVRTFKLPPSDRLVSVYARR